MHQVLISMRRATMHLIVLADHMTKTVRREVAHVQVMTN
jgi:hypothetical protein